MFTPNHLHRLLSHHPLHGRLWLAYSGGLDSHVLLHAIAAIRSQLPVSTVQAIHIHHGLQPAADAWADHCQHISRQLGITCQVIRIDARPPAGASVEAHARTLRYQALQNVLATDETVLTAQHIDDQAETVLLQLLRGTGPAGLAAMAARSRLGRGWRVRPLLSVTRSELAAYAKLHQLQWCEDPSNADTRYDRNFLRQRIIPPLQQRWPALAQVLSRVAQHQATADAALQEYAAQDWQNCHAAAVEQLPIAPLLQLSPARQRQVLRYWLAHNQLPMPATVKLEQILSEVCTAKVDAQPWVHWPGGEVRRFRQTLYALTPLPALPATTWQQAWQLDRPLILPRGRLMATQQQGQGLILPTIGSVQVRLRQGGEVWHWQGHRHKLKKQLQAVPLPTWERAFWPCIFWQNQLVMVPEIGVADGFRANQTQWGWHIEWQRS